MAVCKERKLPVTKQFPPVCLLNLVQIVEMDSPLSDYKKLTVSLLRDELTKRGLDTTGKKPDLIERLDQHDKLLCKYLTPVTLPCWSLGRRRSLVLYIDVIYRHFRHSTLTNRDTDRQIS